MNKNRIYLLLVAGLICLFAFADRKDVSIATKPRHESQISINRSPLYLPIEVIYDSESSIVEVSCYSDLDGEVSVYDKTGNLEDYAPSLNAFLNVTSEGPHTLVIEGETFIGYGTIE